MEVAAKIPGADQATFEKLAAKAKAGCRCPSFSRPTSPWMRASNSCIGDRDVRHASDGPVRSHGHKVPS